jgi:hypothetical protein
MVDYTLATILCQDFVPLMIHIDIAIFSPIYGQTGLISTLETESSHSLE